MQLDLLGLCVFLVTEAAITVSIFDDLVPLINMAASFKTLYTDIIHNVDGCPICCQDLNKVILCFTVKQYLITCAKAFQMAED